MSFLPLLNTKTSDLQLPYSLFSECPAVSNLFLQNTFQEESKVRRQIPLFGVVGFFFKFTTIQQEDLSTRLSQMKCPFLWIQCVSSSSDSF